jgi:hypothetical protein
MSSRSIKTGIRQAVAFNRKVDDVTYFYASRLPGEPAAAVDDRHFHPAEPRTVRLSLTIHL